MTDRRDKLQEAEELIKPEEEEPILVATKFMRQGEAQKGIDAVRQLAKQRGWTVDIDLNERRDRNIGRFVVDQRRILIRAAGRTPEHILYELAHETAHGTLALRAKAQLTREAGIKSAARAIPLLNELELGLVQHIKDSELREELVGDKQLAKDRFALPGSTIAEKAATTLYDHD